MTSMGKSWGKTLLVVNPAAHNGEAAKVKDSVYARVAAFEQCPSLEMVLTSRPGHARTIAAGAHGFDTVLALGGDGLVHELCNGLVSNVGASQTALGVIPFGSGNDYARTLGMPLQLDKALEALKDTHRKLVDTGVCNGEHFCETVSFGLDAAIALDTVERRRRTGKTGTALYAASGIEQLRHHRDVHEVHFALEGGQERRADVILFAVQIGKTYGGGFTICPNANPSDGVFDICMAHGPMGLAKAAVTFARAKDGHHVGVKGIESQRARSLEIRFEEPLPAQIDGERLEGQRFSITCAPQSLCVLSL